MTYPLEKLQRIFEKTGRNPSLNEAWISWINEGFAKKFADIYENGYTHRELEERIRKI